MTHRDHPLLHDRCRRWLAVLLAAGLTALAPGAALAAEEGSGSSGSQQSQRASSLSVGSTGSAVRAVQRRLGVRVTGYFGSETSRAVKRFQRRRGLEVDGVVGPTTARALGVRLGSASYATGGASPDQGSSGQPRTVRLPAVLRRIARCESGGNPRALSPDGRYRGKFQFDLATWRSLGGRGDPARAPEWEQDLRALRLYRKRGTAPWANCA